jgi:hypothetical protein
VLLWAGYGEGAGTPHDPLRILSLTLALRSMTDSPLRGVGLRPLVLRDASLEGGWRDERVHGVPFGGDRAVPAYLVHAFVAHADAALLAVVTTWTPWPQWEDAARVTAQEFADTLTFTPVSFAG